MKQDNPSQPNSAESPKSEPRSTIGQTFSEESKTHALGESEHLRVQDSRASSEIRDPSKTIKDSARELKQGAKEIAKEAREGWMSQQSGRGEGAKDVASAAKAAVGHVKQGAKEILEDTKEGAGDIATTAQAVALDAQEAGKNVLRDAAEGARGVGQMASDAADAAKGAVQEVKSEARGILRKSKDRVVDSAHRVGPAVRRANKATGTFVSHNAVPISLLGFGAGWLLMSGRRQRASKGNGGTAQSVAAGISTESTQIGAGISASARSRERAIGNIGTIPTHENRAAEVVQKAEAMAHEATESVHKAAHGMRERASDIGHRAAHQAEHIRDVVGERTTKLKQGAANQGKRVKAATSRMAESNPFMLIALSLGAGVSTAVLFPRTKQENQLMGGSRDRVVDEAREVASNVGQVAKKAAKELSHTLST